MSETVRARFVVYFNPPDYPHMYVAIKWENSGEKFRPIHDIIIGETIEEVRALIPTQYDQKVPRCEQDAPEIIESWELLGLKLMEKN